MKQKFVTIFALLLCAVLTSCEKEAPEINFSQTTTVEMDVTEVIDAINDMSISMEAKLELIKKQLESSNTSMADKLNILKKAIEEQTIDLNGKLASIETAVKNGVDSIRSEMDLVKDALISSLEQEFAKTDSILDEANKKFDAVNRALTILGVEEGIMPESNRDTLFMHPTAWDVINKDEELNASFARVMNTTDLKVTAKPCVSTPSGAYPQSWSLEDVVVTPDKTSLCLMALHKNQAQSVAGPVEAVVYTHGVYKVEAAMPAGQNYSFTGQKMTQRYDSGSGWYFPGGGVTQNAETGKYELTHTIVDAYNRVFLMPTVFFVVAAVQTPAP